MWTVPYNVDTGLIDPLPPPPYTRRSWRFSIDFEVTNPPPNKETSRPEDNWTTIPYYSTRKLWLVNSKMGVSNWGGFVAYPYWLGGKFGLYLYYFLYRVYFLAFGDVDCYMPVVFIVYLFSNKDTSRGTGLIPPKIIPPKLLRVVLDSNHLGSIGTPPFFWGGIWGKLIYLHSPKLTWHLPQKPKPKVRKLILCKPGCSVRFSGLGDRNQVAGWKILLFS